MKLFAYIRVGFSKLGFFRKKVKPGDYVRYFYSGDLVERIKLIKFIRPCIAPRPCDGSLIYQEVWLGITEGSDQEMQIWVDAYWHLDQKRWYLDKTAL